MVFATGGYSGTKPPNVETLDRAALEAWCMEHRKLLPTAVARWLDGEALLPQ